MIVAHLLPKSTRIRVAVKRQAKGANRITHFRPFLGPTIFRQTNPSRSAPEERLGVRLYRIPLLGGMPGQETIKIASLAASRVDGELPTS